MSWICVRKSRKEEERYICGIHSIIRIVVCERYLEEEEGAVVIIKELRTCIVE